ncbi:MAG TPA: Gfo/Idh/MocA family oxidoreductase [archaeon]|nr:Gfo/Idh/MocA family oxidoreductase [archaeon]
MKRRNFISRNFAAALSGAALGASFFGKTKSAAAKPAETPAKVSGPGGRTLRIGMVELDTSHADSFARAIAEIEGAELTAVVNRGLVYGRERTDKFVQDYKIKHVCKDPAEMVPLIDVALVIGVNWENHVTDAEPFIRAGTPVFVDKPCVGTERDAAKLLDLEVKYRTPIFGGSTYRYSDTLTRFKREFTKRTDTVALTVYGKINSHGRDDMLDLIYYGIHGTELMQELMGLGAVKVNYEDFYRKQHMIHVHYDDRPLVVLLLGWALRENELALLTDKSVERLTPSGGNPYPRIISLMAESISSRRADRPISEQLEACRILIAAKKSRMLGRPVYLSELEDEDGFDGKKFGLEYARFRALPQEEQETWRKNEL